MASGLADSKVNSAVRHTTPESARNSATHLAAANAHVNGDNKRNATPPVEKEGDAFRQVERRKEPKERVHSRCASFLMDYTCHFRRFMQHRPSLAHLN